jgi:hypothetical protein
MNSESGQRLSPRKPEASAEKATPAAARPPVLGSFDPVGLYCIVIQLAAAKRRRAIAKASKPSAKMAAYTLR